MKFSRCLGRISNAVLGLVCLMGSGWSWQALGEVPDNASLFLGQLQLNGQTLEHFEDVMLSPDGVIYLPLEALVRAGEGVYEPTETGVVKIDFGAYQPQVEIDLSRQQLWLNTVQRPWPARGLTWVYGRLLVSGPLLADWFGLDIELASDQLSVLVTSQRPLPADLRRLRERRWQRFGQPDLSLNESTSVTLKTPYQLWGTPRGDVRISMNDSGKNSGLRAQFSGRVDVEAVYLSNRLFFSGDETEIGSLRWTGGRISPLGQAFGLANVYRLEMGDLSSLRLPLAGGAGSGRGIFISTAPLQRPALFDVIEIEGDVLPGWDAELYSGPALIDFQSVGDDGRYSFLDVPLGFGSNELKVILYGPQGQVETRTMQKNINGGQMRIGEWQAQGGLIQKNKTTLPGHRGTGDNGWQLAMRVDYGVSSALTAGVFVGLDQSSNEARLALDIPSAIGNSSNSSSALAHIGISIRPMLGTTTTELVAVTQANGEVAVQVSNRWKWWGVGMGSTLDRYSKGFVSTQRQSTGAGLVDARARLRLNASLGRVGSVALDYGHSMLSDGGLRQEWSPQWRHRWLGANLSHELRMTEEGNTHQSQYRFLASKRADALSLRLQFQAQGAALSTLSAGTVSFNSDYHASADRSFGFGASYAIHSRQLGGSARVAQKVGPGQLALSASLDQAGTWNTGLSYSVGFGHDGRRHLGWMTPQKVGGGSVALRIFEDLDGDGVYSDADRPMAQVGVRVDQRARPERSDEEGWLIVSGLRTDRLVDIDLDMTTLTDPFLTSTRPRVRLSARPGLTHRLELPLQDSGWISGTVHQSSRPMAGVRVIAERLDGLARETTLTLSDGHFAFEMLAPGDWVMSVPDDAMPLQWTSDHVSVGIASGMGRDGMEIEISPPSEVGKIAPGVDAQEGSL